jgi:hypothetical protein
MSPAVLFVSIAIPDVDAREPTAVVITEALEMYPVEVIEPEPNRSSIKLVPFVLIPLSMRVIRLTQDGNELNVILVPDVDATAVPNVLTELVAVAASNVKVLVPATRGADTVIAPLVSPEIITDDIYSLYRTTQRAPLGMVTMMPLLTVMGPVDMALNPVVRV